jgi:hypothetical protein
MTRTEVLQEIRRMRFKEACGGWRERRLTQEEAARLLGVCERTFRRASGGRWCESTPRTAPRELGGPAFSTPCPPLRGHHRCRRRGQGVDNAAAATRRDWTNQAYRRVVVEPIGLRRYPTEELRRQCDER